VGLTHFDEAPSRARQRRADRPDRELERARDLGVIQSFFSHQQRLAVALDEHVERFPSQRSLLSSFNRERLRFDRLIRSRLLAQQLEPVSPSRILACFVSHEIRRHREEPRPFAHDGLLPHGAKEGLLCHLVGPITIAQSPRQIANERYVIFAE